MGTSRDIYLQKLIGFPSHTAMEVCFTALDMIVKIGPKLVDQVDRVFPLFRFRMTGKQHKGHVPAEIAMSRVIFIVRNTNRILEKCS